MVAPWLALGSGWMIRIADDKASLGTVYGMLTLAPLTLGAVTRGVARYMFAKSERRARQLAARARNRLAGLLPAPSADATASAS